MAPQLVRILILFYGFVAIFLALKSQLEPPGFDENGFHREAGPAAVAAHELSFAGIEACRECHEDKIDATPHVKAGVHCESCHGPALEHSKDWEKAKPSMPTTRADCARCHARIVSRPDWYPQIDPKTHNPESKCVDCHEIHPEESAEASK
jgi:hypothetical protein